MRKVRPALLFKDSQVAFIHHRQQQVNHLFGLDGRTIQRTECARHANHRRLTHLQVQVGSFQLDQSLEDLVDLQRFPVMKQTLTQSCGDRLGRIGHFG